MSVLIVGCGLSGAVIAERIASQLNVSVTIIDKRNHIAGNCYDYIDEETGILLNKYGPHFFNTNNEQVWSYINTFDKWIRWEYKHMAYTDNKYVPIPINITTINQLCDTSLQNEYDVKRWLIENKVRYKTITNSEEMAKSIIGDTLYKKLYADYTYKQWNKYPIHLDKSVLSKIRVKPNFDSRYYSYKYQVLPHKGYTHFVKQLLDNKNIQIILNTDYTHHIATNKYDVVVFTGPIDTYFSSLEKLQYRSIRFDIEIIKNMNYYQPTGVVSYREPDVTYTRITEYKHLLNQKSNDTIIVKETSTDIGDPYYPVLTQRNLNLYEEYKLMAKNIEDKNVYFTGGLSNYKYLNMDEAILNSLNFFNDVLCKKYNELYTNGSNLTQFF